MVTNREIFEHLSNTSLENIISLYHVQSKWFVVNVYLGFTSDYVVWKSQLVTYNAKEIIVIQL